MRPPVPRPPGHRVKRGMLGMQANVIERDQGARLGRHLLGVNPVLVSGQVGARQLPCLQQQPLGDQQTAEAPVDVARNLRRLDQGLLHSKH